MITKKIWQEKVDEFNAKPLFIKHVAICQLDYIAEQREKEKQIGAAAGRDYVFYAVVDDVAVAESVRKTQADTPIMSVVFDADKKKWVATNHVFPNPYAALLSAIGYKYEKSLNTDFVRYAACMIGMKDMMGDGQ